MGGVGAERQVSLHSGRNMAGAIRAAGFETVESDITCDNLTILDDGSIDVFFLALHGEFGEDGQLQEILESRNLVYTGSGPQASRLAFDKIVSKKIFREAGIRVGDDFCVDGETDFVKLAGQIEKVGAKFVVKPIKQGSSVGVRIVEGADKAIEAARACLSRYGDCMIEEFIDGKEITVGILAGEPLPIIEVRSKTDFYDYNAKYIDDSTEYLFGTIGDDSLVESIKADAVKCFELLGCRHFGRVDMILSDDNIPCVLEINTLPGLTTHSLLPKAANKAGISNSELCVKIIESALVSFKQKV